MTAAKLKFPPQKYEIGSGDYRFHDDIIDFLKERRLGFTPGFENTTGKQVVKGLSDALFYIQPSNLTLFLLSSRRLHIYLWYGGTIIPESHALFALCCPEIIQSCEELVSPHYYSCRLQGTFFITGVFGDLMKISFQSVHPNL